MSSLEPFGWGGGGDTKQWEKKGRHNSHNKHLKPNQI